MNDRPWLDAYPIGVRADIEIPSARSLADLLDESFRRFGARTAVRFEGSEISYQTLDECSAQFAAYLQSLGLTKGTRAAVMLPNLPQYLVAVAAIVRAGLVLVNVNPLYTARELGHQLSDSGAEVIVVLEAFLPTLAKCRAETSIAQVVSCAGTDPLVAATMSSEGPKPSSKGDAIPFAEALASGRLADFRRPELSPLDVAALQYTGGTTGVAKGAILLHQNLIANVAQNEAWLAPALATLQEDELPTFACVLPLYHILAFVVNMLLTMRIGGTIVLVRSARNPGLVITALKENKIHVLPGLNTLFSNLMAHSDFDAIDWKQLKATFAGGMPTQPSVARRWKERTGCAVCEGYGLSETAASVTCNPPTGEIRESSIGLPFPSTDVVLLADDGTPVSAGEIGQIAVRGPQVMRGYWGREDATPKFINEDGYFLTGDLGTMDSHGYFRIAGRQKDMILVSGFNVYPSEIEAVVCELPSVVECAAVGIEDQATGEAVKLVVVTSDLATTEAHIRAHCREYLTAYKQPKIVEFRAVLPKSAVGKILRQELVAPCAA